MIFSSKVAHMVPMLKRFSFFLFLMFLIACNDEEIKSDNITVDSVAETYLKSRGYEHFIKENEFKSKVALSVQREICDDFDCSKKDTVFSAIAMCGKNRFCSQILLGDYITYRRYYQQNGEFNLYITVLIDSVRLSPIGLYTDIAEYPDEINAGERNISFLEFDAANKITLSLDSIKKLSDSLRKADEFSIQKMQEEFSKSMTIKDSVVHLEGMQKSFLANHNAQIAMKKALGKISGNEQKFSSMYIVKNENGILFLKRGPFWGDIYCMSQNTFERCSMESAKEDSSIKLDPVPLIH